MCALTIIIPRRPTIKDLRERGEELFSGEDYKGFKEYRFEGGIKKFPWLGKELWAGEFCDGNGWIDG